DYNPIGLATFTATRSPISFADEAKAQFSAGRLDDAIKAYQKAIVLEPTRIDYYIQLARIQVYADKAKDAVKTASDAILIDPKN
ncbi:tetratricopeptide repeat protein, partial [Klebsiella pneumoniae]|uniref:tetratricopeptide repeat protein n=1 Tax=Klebsiella pneumoniae TaxID=573 RepID=UPI00132F9C0E